MICGNTSFHFLSLCQMSSILLPHVFVTHQEAEGSVHNAPNLLQPHSLVHPRAYNQKRHIASQMFCFLSIKNFPTHQPHLKLGKTALKGPLRRPIKLGKINSITGIFFQKAFFCPVHKY